MRDHLISDVNFMDRQSIEKWNFVASVDDFLISLYAYYYECGWNCIICNELATLMKMFCTFLLIFCILHYSNWNDIANCKNIDCNAIHIFGSHAFNSFTVFYLLISASFVACMTCRSARKIAKVYAVKELYALMGIADCELKIIAWDKIVASFVALNATNRYIIRPIDAARITSIIMRGTNLEIALIGADIVPKWCMSHVAECMLNMLLDNFIFDARKQFNRSLMHRTRRICVVGRFIGVLMLLLSPFTMLFFVTYMLVHHVSEIRTKSFPSLLEQDFTILAKKKYRCFNELQHEFDTRLSYARPLASQYLNNFPTPIWNAMLRTAFILRRAR